MKNLQQTLGILSISLLTLCAHADVVVMQPLTSFGTNGNGAILPGDHLFLTSASQLQRGMAYNPTTGNLLVVDRSTNSTQPNCDVYVLNGQTGEFIKKLDNNSILSGGNASFAMNLIGVADDGAIYVANLSNGTDVNNPQYRLYRWANEDAGQAYVFPFAAGVADPGNGVDTNSFQKRWGDTLAVRGSGTNTQVVVANRGTLASIFMPTDESMTIFVPMPLVSDAGSAALGLGLTFGAGNTFWGAAGVGTNAPLNQMQFNLAAGTATTLRTLGLPFFSGTTGPILYISSSNLFASMTMVPGADAVRLYDFTNPDAPVLQDRKSFISTNNNNTSSGSLALGTNGVLYALNSDNGIMAFMLTSAASNPLPPAFFLNPSGGTVVAGNSATLTVGADGDAPLSYQWLFESTIIDGATNATLVLTNVQPANGGSYSVVASNALGTATSSSATLTVIATPQTTLLAYDPFAYAAGALIGSQSNWFSSATFGVIDAGNLTITGLAESISNKLTWGANSVSIRFATGTTNLTGSIYFSYILRIDDLGTFASGAGGATVAGFVNGTTSTAFGSKINLDPAVDRQSYRIHTSKGGGQTFGGTATNVIPIGAPALIVARYTFNPNSATDDICDLWVNPDPSTFGASEAPTASVANVGAGGTDLAQIDRFFFRQSSGPARTYADEVRVGLAWSDVVPAAAPSTPPSLTVSRSGSNIIVTWPDTYTGYTLEGTATLVSPSWSIIAYSTSGGNNIATIPAGDGTQFVRLRK